VVNALNILGSNWTVSGETLQAGVSMAYSQMKKDVPGTAEKVLANVDSVSRTGDKVVITNKRDISIRLLGHLEKAISFTVVSVKGQPALRDIKGISIGLGPLAKDIHNWGP
jgi:hypothetical protein